MAEAPKKPSDGKAENVDIELLRNLRFRAVKLVMAEGSESDKSNPFAKATEIVNYVLTGGNK